MAPGQKAPSAKRCIKTGRFSWSRFRARGCQEAPSAKRCIKTVKEGLAAVFGLGVRQHRAPKGALRHLHARLDVAPVRLVRKHRAPKGALRPVSHDHQETVLGEWSESAERQKVHQDMTGRGIMRKSRIGGQKAPSAKRRIKTESPRWTPSTGHFVSESTERHKAH